MSRFCAFLNLTFIITAILVSNYFKFKIFQFFNPVVLFFSLLKLFVIESAHPLKCFTSFLHTFISTYFTIGCFDQTLVVTIRSQNLYYVGGSTSTLKYICQVFRLTSTSYSYRAKIMLSLGPKRCVLFLPSLN